MACIEQTRMRLPKYFLNESQVTKHACSITLSPCPGYKTAFAISSLLICIMPVILLELSEINGVGTQAAFVPVLNTNRWSCKLNLQREVSPSYKTPIRQVSKQIETMMYGPVVVPKRHGRQRVSPCTWKVPWPHERVNTILVSAHLPTSEEYDVALLMLH
jgi:hypothetical protein